MAPEGVSEGAAQVPPVTDIFRLTAYRRCMDISCLPYILFIPAIGDFQSCLGGRVHREESRERREEIRE